MIIKKGSDNLKRCYFYTLPRNKHFDKFRPMHYRDITDYVIGNNFEDTKEQTPVNKDSNTLTTNNNILEPLGEGEFNNILYPNK